VDSKNVLKTVIFSLLVDLQAILSLIVFQTLFLAIQTLTPLFFLTVPNFVVIFRLSDRKFNEDSKNMLKTVIF